MPQKITPRLLSWATDLDAKTIEQARISSELPFIAGHVALMPDAHFGYGATVGSVIPTEGAIIPSAVGVDIGCGMIARQLDLDSDDLPDDLQPLHSLIAQAVPAGVGKGHEHADTLADLREAARKGPELTDKQWQTAGTQMGTLGSGNHFVEVCLDEADRVWIVLHSGSRGIGNQLANIHIDGAKKLMKQYFIELENPDLAYLVEGTPEFEAYIFAMLWAQDYAIENRRVMMEAVHAALDDFLRRDVPIEDEINCHHNFTEREHHHGRNMWITRKGAIRARAGDRGVIPGSMGAQSFIVSGLNNPASFHSCSHGAGRRMSRNQARKELDVAGLEAAMKGKAWNGGPGTRDGNAKQLLDEDPRAYKDIGEVMANQADLVTIDHELRQILNYKGA